MIDLREYFFRNEFALGDHLLVTVFLLYAESESVDDSPGAFALDLDIVRIYLVLDDLEWQDFDLVDALVTLL